MPVLALARIMIPGMAVARIRISIMTVTVIRIHVRIQIVAEARIRVLFMVLARIQISLTVETTWFRIPYTCIAYPDSYQCVSPGSRSLCSGPDLNLGSGPNPDHYNGFKSNSQLDLNP